ncbi:antibiotic biosynthesis monooxygenase family protein [Pseudomonas sp. SB113]|uniref:antibiotic biosynthesis monooxygenase family protein n=1 Tax=Pseudomonas sp. SB113 TaxID=3154123 RepID=UPI00345DA022
MNITAVNTLEIRLIEEADQGFELSLKEYAAVFERVPECLGYSVTRSIYETNLWVFSGYWSAESAMTAHFKSESMTALVNHLIASYANLTFASFAPRIGGAAI